MRLCNVIYLLITCLPFFRDTRIDFGASQVILVRNDTARDALRAQVGEIGLILTLYESKGKRIQLKENLC